MTHPAAVEFAGQATIDIISNMHNHPMDVGSENISRIQNTIERMFELLHVFMDRVD